MLHDVSVRPRLAPDLPNIRPSAGLSDYLRALRSPAFCGSPRKLACAARAHWKAVRRPPRESISRGAQRFPDVRGWSATGTPRAPPRDVSDPGALERASGRPRGPRAPRGGGEVPERTTVVKLSFRAIEFTMPGTCAKVRGRRRQAASCSTTTAAMIGVCRVAPHEQGGKV